jgi:hypothetical protein
LRIDRRDRALLRLHCPADVKTAGCHGQLTVQALSEGRAGARRAFAARSYGLRRGQRAKVTLKLSHRLVRTLKRRGKVLATAREKDRTGRPKTTSKVLAVRVRR